MSKKKSRSVSKSNNQQQQQSNKKKISSVKRNEIKLQCDKLLRLCSDPIQQEQLWENYLEISAVLEKVKRLEEMKTNTSSKRSTAIELFIKWVNENGATIDGTSISDFPSYDLGLKADKDFSANDLILKIPGSIIFSTESAAPELNCLQNDPIIQHMPQVSLAIALLIERHKDNSKWKAYLNILPASYNTVLYMTTNDMIELKGSPTLDDALKHCRNITRQYSYFNQMFHSNINPVSELLRDVFTYEEYCWAVSTVMTRQNIIPSRNGTQMIHALIPMWDMCNHEEGMITTDFNASSDTCECYAKRDFKAGEQIFINYGSRCNSEFFVHSGFVYPNNKNDGYKLRLVLSKLYPFYDKRIDLLKSLDLSTINTTFLIQNNNDPISNELLTFLRVYLMTEDELNYWIESNDINNLKKRNCKLSLETEEKIHRFLLTRIQVLIAFYPTSLQEDLSLLQTTISVTRKMILQLRISEKKILNNALDYVKQQINA